MIREHTDAVIEALSDQGLTVGDGEGKDVGTSASLSPPYCVVYRIPGGQTSGTLENPDENITLVYQVTCIGDSRQAAEWVEDKAMALLSGLIVSGRKVARVSLDMYGGVLRDDDLPGPPLFYSTPRFRVLSVPDIEESP